MNRCRLHPSLADSRAPPLCKHPWDRDPDGTETAEKAGHTRQQAQPVVTDAKVEWSSTSAGTQNGRTLSGERSGGSSAERAMADLDGALGGWVGVRHRENHILAEETDV